MPGARVCGVGAEFEGVDCVCAAGLGASGSEAEICPAAAEAERTTAAMTSNSFEVGKETF